jgi:hypothetical protein
MNTRPNQGRIEDEIKDVLRADRERAGDDVNAHLHALEEAIGALAVHLDRLADVSRPTND